VATVTADVFVTVNRGTACVVVVGILIFGKPLVRPEVLFGVIVATIVISPGLIGSVVGVPEKTTSKATDSLAVKSVEVNLIVARFVVPFVTLVSTAGVAVDGAATRPLVEVVTERPG
jgi:hypothetical protein